MTETGPRPHAAGASLEAEVADAYRSIGYEVERNLQLGGQQVDVLATRVVGGIGVIRVAIECKHRSSGSIGNEIAQDFARAYGHLVAAGLADRAVLVTNQPLTTAAKQVLEAHRTLEATTLDLLRGRAIDPTENLRHFIDLYRRTDTFQNLIPIRLRFTKADSRAHEVDAIEAVAETIASHGRTSMVIFADFGAGKTTLLERVKYEWAVKYLRQGDGPIPVFVRLQDFSRFPNLDEFMIWVLRREFGADISVGSFWSMAEAGRFLLLLDGFDEIAGRVDQAERTRLFLSLAPLLTCSSPALLTSRPGYFASLAEYRALAKVIRGEHTAVSPATRIDDDRSVADDIAEVVMARHLSSRQSRTVEAPVLVECELAPLTTSLIKEYLGRFDSEFQRVLGESSDSVLDLLSKIYDLPDLMRRPILLDMVIETVLSRRLDLKARGAVSPSALYEAYTTAKLGIDWDRTPERRTCLTVAQRRAFAETSAVRMATEGSLSLGARDVEELVSGVDLSSKQRELEISGEEVLNDLRTCSFLTVEGSGSLRFMHKSFFEFFLARAIAPGLLDKSLAGRKILESIELNAEALQFLSDLFWGRLPDRNQVTAVRALIRDANSGATRAALASCALMSGSRLVMLTLQDLSLSQITTRAIQLRASHWTGMTIVGARIGRFEWAEGNLAEQVFQDSRLASVQLVKSRVSGILDRSYIERLQLRESPHAEIRVEGSSIESLQIQESTARFTLSGSGVSQLEAQGTNLRLVGSAEVKSLNITSSVVALGLDPADSPPWVSSFDADVDRDAARSNIALDHVNVESSVLLLAGVSSVRSLRAERSVVVVCDPLSVTAALSNSELLSSLIVCPSSVAGGVSVSRLDGCVVLGLPIREGFAENDCVGAVSVHAASTTSARRRDLTPKRKDALATMSARVSDRGVLALVGSQSAGDVTLRQASESVAAFLLEAVAQRDYEGWPETIAGALSHVTGAGTLEEFTESVRLVIPFDG